MAYETVFVVGAGASLSYGMPTGNELRTLIESRSWIFQSNDTSNSVRGRGPKYTSGVPYTAPDLRRFFQTFGNAPQDSIDRFLATNPVLANVGKICIADVLLEAEQNCNIDQRDTKGHWLQTLFNQMNLSLHPERLGKIAFVTFNYDRLIERYFEQAFEYGCLGKKGLNKFLNVVHVHGSLGDYPGTLFPRKGGSHGTKLLTSQNLKDAVSNIQIIHETQGHQDAKALLSTSTKIVFVGFGFAEENIRKIWPETMVPGRKIFGTTYGLYDSEVERIPMLSDAGRRRIRSSGRIGPMGGIADDCETVLRKYNLLPRLS